MENLTWGNRKKKKGKLILNTWGLCKWTLEYYSSTVPSTVYFKLCKPPVYRVWSRSNVYKTHMLVWLLNINMTSLKHGLILFKLYWWDWKTFFFFGCLLKGRLTFWSLYQFVRYIFSFLEGWYDFPYEYWFLFFFFFLRIWGIITICISVYFVLLAFMTFSCQEQFNSTKQRSRMWPFTCSPVSLLKYFCHVSWKLTYLNKLDLWNLM